MLNVHVVGQNRSIGIGDNVNYIGCVNLLLDLEKYHYLFLEEDMLNGVVIPQDNSFQWATDSIRLTVDVSKNPLVISIPKEQFINYRYFSPQNLPNKVEYRKLVIDDPSRIMMETPRWETRHPDSFHSEVSDKRIIVVNSNISIPYDVLNYHFKHQYEKYIKPDSIFAKIIDYNKDQKISNIGVSICDDPNDDKFFISTAHQANISFIDKDGLIVTGEPTVERLTGVDIIFKTYGLSRQLSITVRSMDVFLDQLSEDLKIKHTTEKELVSLIETELEKDYEGYRATTIYNFTPLENVIAKLVEGYDYLVIDKKALIDCQEYILSDILEISFIYIAINEKYHRQIIDYLRDNDCN